MKPRASRTARHRRLGARADQADLLHRGDPGDDLLGQLDLARASRCRRRSRAPPPPTRPRPPRGAGGRGSSAPRSRPGRRTRLPSASVMYGPSARGHEAGRAADGAERAHRRVDAAGHDRAGAGEQCPRSSVYGSPDQVRSAAAHGTAAPRQSAEPLQDAQRVGQRAAVGRAQPGHRSGRPARARTAARGRSCPGSASAGPGCRRWSRGRSRGGRTTTRPRPRGRRGWPRRTGPGRRCAATGPESAPASSIRGEGGQAGGERVRRRRRTPGRWAGSTFASGSRCHQRVSWAASVVACMLPGGRERMRARVGTADPVAGAGAGAVAQRVRAGHSTASPGRRTPAQRRSSASRRACRFLVRRASGTPTMVSPVTRILRAPDEAVPCWPMAVNAQGTYRDTSALVARTLTHRTTGSLTANPVGLSSAQRARDLGGPVGEDDVGARAADRDQRLHDHPVPVDPAVGRGRLDHRVLAADLVGGHRHVHRVADPA